MKSIKLYSVAGLVLLFLGFSTNLSPMKSRSEIETTTLLSVSVDVSLQDQELSIVWNSLRAGNRLEVSINGQKRNFFNEAGAISSLPALPAENLIELAEIHPLSNSEQNHDLEAFKSHLFVLGSKVDGVNVNDAAFGADALPSATRLRYQTFIPEKYVGLDLFASSNCIPLFGLGNTYAFGGDDRSFNPDGNNYRTRFDVRIDWLSNGNQVALTSVGESFLYKWNDAITGADKWDLQDSKTQGTGGMSLTVLSESSTLAHFRMLHNVGDPFCFYVNPVYYNLDVYISRAGVYTITGTRNRVPNHEVYIRTNLKTDWTMIYQRPYYSYSCLWPGFYDSNCINTPNLQSMSF
jgi:hypothetical protein